MKTISQLCGMATTARRMAEDLLAEKIGDRVVELPEDFKGFFVFGDKYYSGVRVLSVRCEGTSRYLCFKIELPWGVTDASWLNVFDWDIFYTKLEEVLDNER